MFSHRRPSQGSVPTSSVFNSPRASAAVTSPKTPGNRPVSGIPHFKLDSVAPLPPFPESETRNTLTNETALDGAPLQAHDEREFILPPPKIGFISEERVTTFDDDQEINLTKLDRMLSI